MQSSARHKQLEALFASRRTPKPQPQPQAQPQHLPQISITDPNHQGTEAIGSYYEPSNEVTAGKKQDSSNMPSAIPPITRTMTTATTIPTEVSTRNTNGVSPASSRPLSFVSSPEELVQSKEARKAKRNGSYFDNFRSGRPGAARTVSGEAVNANNPATTGTSKRQRSPNQRAGGSNGSANASTPGSPSSSPSSPLPSPSLTSPQQSSSDTAVSQFPLNDIDYESSPAAVAKELSNLQAIRRMSMNVDTADPDLPSFALPAAPGDGENSGNNDDDAARLFWVPARLHPELAPKEFKTFIEERVEKIKRRSGSGSESDGSGGLSPDALDRTGSNSSSLRRKKSMLSRQIDGRDGYQDGAERLERKKSTGLSSVEMQTPFELSELETLVNDPEQLMRRLSLDNARRSLDSGPEGSADEDMGLDMPMLPPGGRALKRSTRTAYRRGSLRKGERVPFSRRAQQRQTESDVDESAPSSPIGPSLDEPLAGLSRVQTEPVFPLSGLRITPQSSRPETTPRWRETAPPDIPPQTEIPSDPLPERNVTQPTILEGDQQPPASARPQHRPFQSRLASGQGRTTAHLPGYDDPPASPQTLSSIPNAPPQIAQTPPETSTIVSTPHSASALSSISAPSSASTANKKSLAAPLQPPQQQQPLPERRSSHEPPRRGGAHSRPALTREQQSHTPQRSSTLDDISSRPSPLPGVGNTSTDALTLVPTFEGREGKRDSTSSGNATGGGNGSGSATGGKKSGWKWILGGAEGDSSKDKEREKEKESANAGGAKNGKLVKPPSSSPRLDVLQASAASGANAPIVSARGRESLVLNREDLRLEEERRKESKKSAESKKDRDASSSGGTGGGGGSRESGLLSALFGGKKKSANSNSNSDEGGGGAALLSPGGKQGNKRRKSDRNLSPSSGRDFWGNNSSHTSSGGNAHRPNSAQGYHPRDLKADIDYNWTRFSILEERAIYRMAHIKLANPRRALYSQVLLSNFMYSYLAKVQMMHPLVQGAGSSQQSGGQQQQHQQQQHKQGPGQRGQERQSEEFSQYQRWQQQQEREAAAAAESASTTATNSNAPLVFGPATANTTPAPLTNNAVSNKRTSLDILTSNSGGAVQLPQQQPTSASTEHDHLDPSAAAVDKGGDYSDYDRFHPSSSNGAPNGGQRRFSREGFGSSAGGTAGSGGGYAVAGTHDYLGLGGYLSSSDSRVYGQEGDLWR